MDKYLVSLAIALLFLECGWLLSDLDIISLPGIIHQSGHNKSSVLGKITESKKEVKRREKNSLVWEHTHDDEDLLAYDSVLTLTQSTAQINLNNKNRITLGENTLVTIEPPRDGTDSGPVRLRFRKGAMRAFSEDGSQSSPLEFGEWVLETGDQSDVTIRSQGSNGEFEIETHAGEVKIVSSDGIQEKILKAGEVAGIKEKSFGEVQKSLDIKWEAPVDGARIYTHGRSASVPLKWTGPADEAVILKPDEQKTENIHLEGKSEVPMNRGNYVIRLRNKENITFARNIAVWEAPKIYLISPLIRQRIKLGSTVELFWTLNLEIKNYEWQIATDEFFKHIVQKGESKEHNTLVRGLPLGTFYWRVLGKDDQGYVIPEMYINNFSVVTNPLEAPKLKTPTVIPDEALLEKLWHWLIPSARADDEVLQKHYQAIFQWEEVQGADSYAIEISETSDFRNPVIKETVRTSEFKWKDFKLGKYFWRVAAQSDGGDVGIFSEVALSDLRTVPKKPITPMPISPNVEIATVKPVPSPIPIQTPTPEIVVTTTISITPTLTTAAIPEPEKPTLPLAYEPNQRQWSIALQAGGHGAFTYFKGTDFNATQVGITGGDYRGIFRPQISENIFRIEGEYQKEKLKIKNTSLFPFQDVLQVQTYRFSILKESPYQGAMSFGVTTHNQHFVFVRADLENLSLQTPWSAGPIAHWKYIYSNYETEYRAGVIFGQITALEGRAARVYLFHINENFIFTITGEINGAFGMTSSKNSWTDASGFLFLGVRW